MNKYCYPQFRREWLSCPMGITYYFTVPSSSDYYLKYLNVRSGIGIICVMYSGMGYGACAIRAICAACGSARLLVLHCARHSSHQARILTEAMLIIVASLRASIWALNNVAFRICKVARGC
jgi:hypothetical protein